MYDSLKVKGLKDKLLFLLKDTAIYGVAGAFNQLIKILTVPFVARFYTKDDFGANDLLNTLLFLTVPFVFFGLDSALARFYFEYEDFRKKRQLVFFCFIIGLFLSILSMIFLGLFEREICSGFLKVTAVHDSYWVIIWTVPFLFISSFFTNLFKYNFDRKSYLLQTVGGGMITVVLTFIFVVMLKLPIIWTLTAHLISRVFFSAVALLKIGDHAEPGIDQVEVKPLLTFAIPFMVTSVLGIWIPSMDRFVLTNYLGVSAVAVYALGQRITGILSLPLKSFQTAWGPFSLALYKDQNAGITYSKTLLYSTLVLCIFSILIMGLQQPLILFFGSAKYLDATKVIPLLSLFIIVQNLLGILATGISLSKKTHFFIISYLISIAISYVTMRMLLTPFGSTGIAAGLIIGQFCNTLFLNFISKKVYPQLKILALEPIIFFLLSFITASCITYFNNLNWYVHLFISILSILVILLIFFSLFIENPEKEALKKIKNKALKYVQRN